MSPGCILSTNSLGDLLVMLLPDDRKGSTVYGFCVSLIPYQNNID